jgi:zinc transporter 7
MILASSALVAALVSTGFISLAPNLILFAFPGFAEEGAAEHSVILSTGQALAAGALLGDVFLHTVPEAGGDEYAGLWVLLGFTCFLIMDLVIHSLDTAHDHADHGHSTPATNGLKTEKKPVAESSTLKLVFSSSIILNLTADALHNFTDGLAIGASFATASDHSSSTTWQSLLTSRGGLATLSVLFHEIPHELGDYCILLKHGFSKTQAIAAQFGTALAAFLGAMVGVWAASTWSGVTYITAGGFVYLASVSILPEVLEEGRKSGALFRVLQLLAFLMGVGFLFSVSLIDADDHGQHHNSLHHHHSHTQDLSDEQNNHGGHNHHHHVHDHSEL